MVLGCLWTGRGSQRTRSQGQELGRADMSQGFIGSTHIYIYTHTYIYICTCTYEYLYTYIYMYVDLSLSLSLPIYIYLYMYLYIYIRYVSIYIYIYVMSCGLHSGWASVITSSWGTGMSVYI